jgi:transposase-like protein
MASEASAKGKRYTATEKQKIVSYVNQVKEANGRGGLTAAAKKFGVSPLTVGTWMKGMKAAGDAGTVTGKAGLKGIGGRSKILDQLAVLDREIATKRRELAAIEAAFNKLKAKL